MTPRERREAQALEAWPALAAQAGLDPTAFSVTNRWFKEEAQRAHAVLRLDGPGGPVVLKRAFRPETPEKVAGILAALNTAERALAGSPQLGVPRVLARAPDARAYLMSFVQGETLSDHCERTADHRPALRRAGEWLSAYHRGSEVERREYRPHVMARHLEKLADQAEQCERRVREPARFAALARQLAAQGQTYGGRPSVVAAKHGDLNLRNLMLGAKGVTGLDFQPESTAPVGHDIARLLVNYMAHLGDLEAVPEGEVLPPAILGAFFEGYELVGPDDPSVSWLLRVQVLTDWNRLPEGDGLQALIRFGRISALAERAFGG